LKNYKNIDINNIIIGLDTKEKELLQTMVDSDNENSSSSDSSTISSDEYCIEFENLTEDIEKKRLVFSHSLNNYLKKTSKSF